MRPYAATDFARVLDLYAAVGWTAYTKAPEVLRRALDGSSTVVIETVVIETVVIETVVPEAEVPGVERVLGLARVVSDGATICYLQDVLVHPSARRTGLGSRLVTAALEPYAAVRQKVLLTDDEAGQKAFYEALGYSSIEGTTLRAFTRFD